MSSSTLADLHKRTVESHAGFLKMVEKAEPEFRPVAQRFHDLHHNHMNRLSDMMRSMGEQADNDGGLGARMQEAVISVRSWVDEIDDDTMDQVRMGEKNVLEAFDAAIGDPDNSAFQAELGIMKGELTTLLDDTAHID